MQTEIRVGHLAMPRKHDDYETLDQAVKILGGEGANRLQQVLRSQRQLTYGASADLDTLKFTGAIVAETDTQTAATAEALRVVVEEFARLQRERVNEAELDGAQDYMVGHFPLTIETPDAIATQVLNQLFYDLPVEDLPKFRERVLKVTPDDIQRVARWFVRPDQLSVVLVGNADAVRGQPEGRRVRATTSAFPSRSSASCPRTSAARRRAGQASSDASDDLVRRAVGRSVRRRARRRAAGARSRLEVFGLGGEQLAAPARDWSPTSGDSRSPASPRR